MPTTVPAKPGQTFTINEVVYDQTNAAMPGASVSWMSSNTGVATVNSAGVVNCVGVGSATITATAGSATNTVIVNVSAATPTTIALAPTTPTPP